MLCSDTQAAPCIVNNDGTSPGALNRPVITPAFMITMSVPSAVHLSQRSLLLAAMYVPNSLVTIRKRYVKCGV